MAKTIWKFPVPMDGRPDILMPSNSAVLSVGVQNGEPFVWALVDTDSRPSWKSFLLVGTGHPADGVYGEDFVGTFQLNGGALVFHLFTDAHYPTGGDLNDD